jgi:hypothetical protein
MTRSGSICSGGIGSYSYLFARQRGSFIYILRRLVGIIDACVSGGLPSTGRDETVFAKPGFFISMDPTTCAGARQALLEKFAYEFLSRISVARQPDCRSTAE